jgi:hypothetical protein
MIPTSKAASESGKMYVQIVVLSESQVYVWFASAKEPDPFQVLLVAKKMFAAIPPRRMAMMIRASASSVAI